jgi:hypothetical protein
MDTNLTVDQRVRVDLDWMKMFNTDIDRRDFISIGAASGLLLLPNLNPNPNPNPN